ncbi:MAG: hypothetical protein KF729_34245 [Sandaracinaceae bacterium]|nr:hypothetical protein [Sandaracinaceae bacterium]
MRERTGAIGSRRRAAPIAALAAGLAVACGPVPEPLDAAPPSDPAPVALGAPDPGAREPAGAPPGASRGGVRIYPETLLELVPGDPRDAVRLGDVALCQPCHVEVYDAWRASVHAASSFDNPWYRQAFDAFRAEQGAEASRFCSGCHDPVMLLAGAVDVPIEATDPRAQLGVTCMVCHGAVEVRADGNASYTLSTSPVPIPDPANREEVAVHVAALTPAPLRTAALCGTCHRGFLGPDMHNPHFLGGVDDLTPWARSAFAGSRASRLDAPVEEATCQGCHMAQVPASDRDFATTDGHIATHRVPGAHTALAAARGDDAQREAIAARLADVARVDVAALRSGGRSTRPADGARLAPGAIELDVVVRNLGVGHHLPGGTRDLQDTWLEVEVRDADGALVAEAGTRHAQTPDETAHRLFAAPVDDEAEVQLLHHVQHFRAMVFDRTIAPRDAEVVRYAFELAPGVAQPLSVDVRLRHRRHARAMYDAACEATRSERGRAFLATAVTLGRAPIDACVPQPIVELASARVWLGEGASSRAPEGGATAPAFARLFDHALARIGDVSEHLDDARPSLAAALRAATTDRERARVHLQSARLEARQGRLAAALAAAGRAERLAGEGPAIHRVRGDAYAQVWRWEDAAAAYRRAAEGAPGDDGRWTDLARALGSAGRDAEALLAADVGLRLTPQSGELLRTRYLALDAAGADDAELARAAYLARRPPDRLSELQLRSGVRDPACARERMPMHVHALRPAR